MVLFLVGASWPALAQTGPEGWTMPVNLSHSGAASDPAIVPAPDGSVRVFWWDRFDGVMVSQRDAGDVSPAVWSEPAAAPILIASRVGEETVWQPVQTRPRIVGDANGNAHAFWDGAVDRDSGVRALMYSRLAVGATRWSTPEPIAAQAVGVTVVGSADGRLHLVYVRPLDDAAFPAGVYYKQLAANSVSWRRPVKLYESLYFRLLPAADTPEAQPGAWTRLGVDDEGIYVTWDDPRLGQAMIAWSSDGGESWSEPRWVDMPGTRPQRGRFVSGDRVSLLWQDARVSGLCSLYQAPVDDILAGEQGTVQRPWEGLRVCPQNERFFTLRNGATWMVYGLGGSALSMSIWERGQWSDPAVVDLQFRDQELDQPIHLRSLQLALVADVEAGVERPIVVGGDQFGEVWVVEARSALDLIAAAPESTPVDASPLAGPVNLSRSEAASRPTVIAGADGRMRVFWWDRFDGLTVADGVMQGDGRAVWGPPRGAPLPVEETPCIVGDAAGRAHAFWVQMSGEEEGVGALMYSQLPPDAVVWTTPAEIAASVARFDVIVDLSDRVHLVYVRTVFTQDLPAGVYYRGLGSGGVVWEAPVLLHGSRYFRLLSPQDAYIRVASGDNGDVYVTWDDPRLGQVVFTASDDGGRGWRSPWAIGGVDAPLQHGRFVVAPEDGAVRVLWEDGNSFGGCTMYQAWWQDLQREGERAGQRVLTGLRMCPGEAQFWPLSSGQVLMLSGHGGDALLAALLDDEGAWSEPRQLTWRFEDDASGRQVYLRDVRGALARPAGDASRVLLVSGVDYRGDVWVTNSQMGDLGIIFAPPSPWMTAVDISSGVSEADAAAVVVDGEGRTHALWSGQVAPETPRTVLYYAQGKRPAANGGALAAQRQWSRPMQVLGSPDGYAGEPDLAVWDDHLHAVWSDGVNGEVWYSRVFIQDAYAAQGWAAPQPLPAPVLFGDWPHIAVDGYGVLHVVYAVPLNEGRGVYYTRSEDGGQSWISTTLVFDAAAAGWSMVDSPGVAVDGQGTVHVVWRHAALPGKGPSQGIFYARLLRGDDGERLGWSEPVEIAAGAYRWPQVVAGGEGDVHLIWRESAGSRVWWHRWSSNGGEGWSRPERVRGLDQSLGAARAVGYGPLTRLAFALHVVGLGQDVYGRAVLLHTVWDGRQWGGLESVRLDVEPGDEAGVAAALQPELGQLGVVFGDAQAGLWYSERLVAAVEVTPLPTFTPQPTSTPLPAMPTSTPVPTVNVDAPPPVLSPSVGPVDLSLPLVVGGLLAALIVGGVLAVRQLGGKRR